MRDQEFRARDKLVQKMTRDGLTVERHITANLNVTLFPRENLLFRHIITRK